MQKIIYLALALFALAILIAHNIPSYLVKGQVLEKESQVHDSITVLLDGKTIPSKSFIHLYDSTPSTVNVGHVAAHLPCNSGGDTDVKVVGGIAPDLLPLNMTRVDELSVLGTVCMYHTDIPQQNGTTITDIALLNPTDESITLPDTSTVVIHISEFAPGAEHNPEDHS